MRPQFGQLRCGKVLDVNVPPGTPKPWIIEKIRKKQPLKDDRPQPTVEVPDEDTWRRWEQYKKDQERKPEVERGVTVVDYTL